MMTEGSIALRLYHFGELISRTGYFAGSSERDWANYFFFDYLTLFSYLTI